MPTTALVVGLFYYWFAIADRHIVFLYYHDMGSVVPDTSPFSPVTGSRYWMAGLVACGGVMLLQVALNWLLGRMVSGYSPPPWWQVWALCAPALLIAVPAITMTVNSPRLPLSNAMQATAAAIIGLAPALLPRTAAARKPVHLLWDIADGLWVMLVLVTIAGLQNLPRWLATGGDQWIALTTLMLICAIVWLLVVTALRHVLGAPHTSGSTMLVAGACFAYLFLPLLHHVAFTDGYFYITNSNNFFADDHAYQSAALLIAAGLALGTAVMRTGLAGLRSSRRRRQQHLVGYRR